VRPNRKILDAEPGRAHPGFPLVVAKWDFALCLYIIIIIIITMCIHCGARQRIENVFLWLLLLILLLSHTHNYTICTNTHNGCLANYTYLLRSVVFRLVTTTTTGCREAQINLTRIVFIVHGRRAYIIIIIL